MIAVAVTKGKELERENDQYILRQILRSTLLKIETITLNEPLYIS